MDIKMYTDGSSHRENKHNPWVGCSSFLLMDNNGAHIDEGHLVQNNCTSARSELVGAVLGLDRISRDLTNVNKVDIYSDSEYLTRALNYNIHEWSKWNFITFDGYGGKINRPNSDVLKILRDFQNRYDVRGFWVKGHSKNEFNEHVHNIAYEKRKGE